MAANRKIYGNLKRRLMSRDGINNADKKKDHILLPSKNYIQNVNRQKLTTDNNLAFSTRKAELDTVRVKDVKRRKSICNKPTNHRQRTN